MLLESALKYSASLSYVISWAVDGWAFILVYDFTFCNLMSLSLGAISRSLMVWHPLKCTLMPFLLQVLLNFSPNPCM